MSKKNSDILLEAISKFPNGASQTDVVAGVKLDKDELLEALNELINSQRIKLLQDATGKVIYKALSSTETTKLQGLNVVDRAVYQTIEAVKEKGIWIRDIVSRSGVKQIQVSKSLKILEQRKLIKAVKSITKKKVYILEEYTPTAEHQSVWYTDKGELNMDLIIALQREVLAIILAKPFTSAEDIADAVQKSGHVSVKAEDIEQIANTLVYDGLVEESKDPRERMNTTRKASHLYRPMRLKRPKTGFVDTPCGKCPVFDRCAPGGDISPETCVYYTSWFEEF